MTGPDDRFAIVKIPPTGPAPAESIVIGPMNEVMEYIGGSIARNEKEARLAQAERDAAKTAKVQAETRACAAQMLADGLTHLSNRLDAFETRRQHRLEQQKRAEEAAEAKEAEEFVASLPDPEDPEAFDNPRATGDDGDLEAIKPLPDTEKLDPEGEARSEAATGAMPKELDKDAPSEIGEFGAPLPPRSPYRDPTSIGGP
jgi:hypothetical protein